MYILKQILLVEPDKKVADIIKEYLEKDGLVAVHCAHTAQEGVHVADKVRPELVILELAIPMHNGFAFLHEFRSYADWSEIPVIVHSHLAKDEAAMSKSWKVLGAVNYFYKPQTTLAKLKAAVYEVLGV